MNKKEKLEYFKLVEPKLREKMLNGELKDSDFEGLNIKGKDIQLFKEKYQDFWFGEVIQEVFFEDEEFKNLLDEDAFELDFPEDKYFYQFGVPNLDIEMFKFHLESKERLLNIDKLTGGVEIQNSVRIGNVLDDKNIQNKINLVIDNPFTFLQQLKSGEIDKILANQKNNPSRWEIPDSHKMKKGADYIDVDALIDILGQDQQWIMYNNYFPYDRDMSFKNFQSFENLDSLKFTEIEIYKGKYENGSDDDLSGRFFFKVDNPLKMRFELINGNMEVLNEIKEINFCSIFDPRKNEA